jgi:hypothetical protein
MHGRSSQVDNLKKELLRHKDWASAEAAPLFMLLLMCLLRLLSMFRRNGTLFQS